MAAMLRRTAVFVAVVLGASLPTARGAGKATENATEQFNLTQGMAVGEVRTLSLQLSQTTVGNGNRANGMALLPDGSGALVLDDQMCVVKVHLGNFPAPIANPERLAAPLTTVACITNKTTVTTRPAAKNFPANCTSPLDHHYCWMDAGLAVTPDGAAALVSDTRYQRILSVNLTTGKVSLVAGTPDANIGQVHNPKTRCADPFKNGDGNVQYGEAADFNYPSDIVVSPGGTLAYVADMCNNRVRKIRLSDGQVKSINLTPGIKHPSRVAINKEGTTLFVTASKTDAAVFKLPVSQDFSGTDGPVEVIAGNTNGPQDRGYVGDGTTLAGTATSVKLGGPRGIAVTPTGTVLVTDAYNHRVLQIQDTKGTDAQRSRRPSRTVRYV